MKTLLTLLLSAAALRAAPDSRAPARVAVFDFQAEGAAATKLGGASVGRSIANVLTADLSSLLPVTVVDSAEVRESLSDRKVQIADPLEPSEASQVGRTLGATTLVSGRVYMDGNDIIIAAKVVSATTGQTLGAMAKADASTTVADAVSLLGTQVGRIALSQQGNPDVPWAPAEIVGTARGKSLFSVGEVACVMAVDGVPIPDETEKWELKRALLPGFHDIFVRYYDGTSVAGENFTLEAMPGQNYEVSFERPQGQKPKLWIREQLSGRAVTPTILASVGEPPRVIQGRISFDLRGIWSESNNPTPYPNAMGHSK